MYKRHSNIYQDYDAIYNAQWKTRDTSSGVDFIGSASYMVVDSLGIYRRR